MKRTLEAVFQDGVFRPVRRPDLPEGERVLLTVESVGQSDAADVVELAARVYEGLSPKDVDEIEAMATHRPVFEHPSLIPTSMRGQRQRSASEAAGKANDEGDQEDR